MANREKLATYRVHRTKKYKTKQKHNTICFGHHYAQANTNNVNEPSYKQLEVNDTTAHQCTVLLH